MNQKNNDARDAELSKMPEFDENLAIKKVFILNAATKAFIFNGNPTERYFSENNAMEIALDLARWQFQECANIIAARDAEIEKLKLEVYDTQEREADFTRIVNDGIKKLQAERDIYLKALEWITEWGDVHDAHSNKARQALENYRKKME